MKAYRTSSVVAGVVICVLTLSAIGWVSVASAADSGVSVVRRPWLMVSLAPHGTAGVGGKAFSVIKRLSGNPNGMVMHFTDVTCELVAEKQFEFIILSPQGTPWCRYSGARGIALQNFLWALPVIAEEMNIPILGICGGHQALALAFGGKVGPVRATGEDDCMPYTRDRQGGVLPLTRMTQDPIFEGIHGPVRIVESHYDEVKALPRDFVLLASEKLSPIQIMRHPSKPVYGIQGHPEHFNENRPDGRLLISNFLKIAAEHNRKERKVFAEANSRLVSMKGKDKKPE